MHEELAQCNTSGPCVFVMCHATVFLQDHVAMKRHGTVQVHKSMCPNIRQHEVQVPNVTAQAGSTQHDVSDLISILLLQNSTDQNSYMTYKQGKKAHAFGYYQIRFRPPSYMVINCKWIRYLPMKKICRIFWHKKVSSEELYLRTECNSVTHKIKRRRLRWLGHVLRIDQGRTPKVALRWTPPASPAAEPSKAKLRR